MLAQLKDIEVNNSGEKMQSYFHGLTFQLPEGKIVFFYVNPSIWLKKKKKKFQPCSTTANSKKIEWTTNHLIGALFGSSFTFNTQFLLDM